jgi:hypothetical protein
MRRTPCVQRSQSRERVFVSRASWMRENRSVESIGFCESPGERPRRRTSSFIEGEAPSPRRRALAGRQGRKTAVGMDRWRCEACPTEPRASASGRHPRAKVTSDSLTLAVPCCAGVEFFMGFRGPKADSDSLGSLSHIASKNRLAESAIYVEFPGSRFQAPWKRSGSGSVQPHIEYPV